MKILKDSLGSFAFPEFTPDGTPNYARKAGYTSADDVKEMGIWKVTNAESSDVFVDNLPGTNSYGILIVLKYSSTFFIQYFITTHMTSQIYHRIYRNSAWGTWNRVTCTEVTA